ncbi:MAG: hypothetical protein ACFFED_01470 [Candidatus Thorarchaeota archaeon]
MTKAERDPSAFKKHMMLFDWGFMAKRIGKEKRFEKEVRDVVLEFLNGQSADVPPLDTYLRALGIDGYEIMMKIKDHKKRIDN